MYYIYTYILNIYIYILYIYITILYKYIYIYIIYIHIYVHIHHWQILCNSYRKLAWVGFEPATTELRSDALTDWAIRAWVELTLRAKFVQLLQFHRFFSVTFHFDCLALSVATFILIEVSCREWHECSGMNW